MATTTTTSPKFKVRDYVTVGANGVVFEVLRSHPADAEYVRVSRVDGEGEPQWLAASRLRLFAEYLASCSPCGCPVYTRIGTQHGDECKHNEPASQPVVPEPRTREADGALADEIMFSERAQRGRRLAVDMPWIVTNLTNGGDHRWATQRNTQEEGRDALRAFAQWLLDVAERAS